jgi:LysR family transcriptional regulator (chromosome initiation inhibitor)
MVCDLHAAARGDRLPLVDMLPGSTVDVALYWHHWARESVSAQRLTQAVKAAATVLGG